ncbi:hypothetical protein MTO96_031758 [Rhipicephalus appendiculatus]
MGKPPLDSSRRPSHEFSALTDSLRGGKTTASQAQPVGVSYVACGERREGNLAFSYGDALHLVSSLGVETGAMGGAKILLVLAVAEALCQNAINETGFGYLEIYTNEKLPDEYQAYGAGFLEGYLTRDLIRMHFDNQWADYCVNETAYCKKLYNFFDENVRHMNEQAEQYRSTSPYWHQVDLILNQMAGLDDARRGHTKYFPSWSYVNATDLL